MVRVRVIGNEPLDPLQIELLSFFFDGVHSTQSVSPDHISEKLLAEARGESKADMVVYVLVSFATILDQLCNHAEVERLLFMENGEDGLPKLYIVKTIGRLHSFADGCVAWVYPDPYHEGVYHAERRSSPLSWRAYNAMLRPEDAMVLS